MSDIDELFDDPMLGPEEVSRLLGVSTATLALWRKKRIGPQFARLGSREKPLIKYQKSDVDEYINEHKVEMREFDDMQDAESRIP